MDTSPKVPALGFGMTTVPKTVPVSASKTVTQPVALSATIPFVPAEATEASPKRAIPNAKLGTRMGYLFLSPVKGESGDPTGTSTTARVNDFRDTGTFVQDRRRGPMSQKLSEARREGASPIPRRRRAR